MPPNQLPTSDQTLSSQPNYDFFLNPPPPPKKPLINFGSTSLTKRISVVIGGIIGLIIIIVILSSLLGSHTNYIPIITVVQDQNELIRVAAESTNTATEQSTLNLDQNVELSLTSDQQQLLAYLKNNGQVPSTLQLGATKDASTDKALAAAKAVSNYDVVFTQIMETGLKDYFNDIKSAYATAGPKGKILLKQDAVNAKLLLTQATDNASLLAS